MSGASAAASARRRRASNQSDTQISNSNQSKSKNVTIEESVVTNNTSQQITPLQLLQIHSSKIKKLEQMLETNLNDERDDSNNINKNDNDIISKIMTKVDEIYSSKISNMSNTIKSLLMEIEKLNIANKNYEKNTEKIDSIVSDLDNLKTLVIKNQNFNIECNLEIIKFQNKLDEISDTVIKLSNEKQENLYNNRDSGMLNMQDPNILLKSMLESALHSNSKNMTSDKLNIYDSDDSDGSDKESGLDDSLLNDIEEITGSNNINGTENIVPLNIKEEIVEIIDTAKELFNKNNIDGIVETVGGADTKIDIVSDNDTE